MIDNRVTLPLDKARAVADVFCQRVCGEWPHVHACLVPHLEARDRMVAEDAERAATGISGDCLDPVKHGACSGCLCSCHRHSNRGTT